jgi:hypothetical protein
MRHPAPHDNLYQTGLSRNLRDLLKYLVGQLLKPGEASLTKLK